MENTHMKFCQSCGMPIETKEVKGTNKDQSLNEDYCIYCYKDGAFTGEMTMQEMIDYCAPLWSKENADMTEEQAREAMQGFFPQLKRWRA